MDPLINFDVIHNYSLTNSIYNLNLYYLKYNVYDCAHKSFISSHILQNVCDEFQHASYYSKSFIYKKYFDDCFKFVDETEIDFYKRCYKEFKKDESTSSQPEIKAVYKKISNFIIYITNIRLILDNKINEEKVKKEKQLRETELKKITLKCLRDMFGRDLCSIILKY